MRRAAALAALLTFCAGCGKNNPGTFAVLSTSMGVIKIRLFTDQAPKTCENFVGLALGTKEWKDPKTGMKTHAPLYDGAEFHRVIPGFMIQTGDPSGKGDGGAGFTIADEFYPGLKFDKAGLVGMANWGPNTNSSQFFITLAPTPDLDGQHPIFGEVVEGMDVARKISLAPRNEVESSNRPLKPIYLIHVGIEGL